jgi:HEAT repeat protein
MPASQCAAHGAAESSTAPTPTDGQNRTEFDSDGRPVATLIAGFLNPTRPFSERRQDAQRLAEIKTPQALQALIAGFGSEQGENRRFLAELMGKTGEAIFGKSLKTLLESGDDADAAVAIRALAAIGGDENTKTLAGIMKDDGWPDALRSQAAMELLNTGTHSVALAAISGLAAIGGDANCDTLAAIVRDTRMPEALRLEAALGLGVIGSPRAGDALVQAFSEFSDPEIHAQLLDSLGHFPFPQIESTFKQFMAASDTPDELRSAAAEALAYSSREAVPFLLDLAASDRDPNVREMAAWALSSHGPMDALGTKLTDMTRVESEADVRRRLYEVLLVQEQNPAATLLPVIQSESDTAARVAGFNALGDAVGRDPTGVLATEFNELIVPELAQIALAPGNLNIRMRAVFALRRAETPAAFKALADISVTQPQQIAQAAINGLRSNVQQQEQ